MVNPEVDTAYGRLRGQVQHNIDGGDFFAFKGIPYAKPPVGKLRFKDPVRAEPWTGTRDALKFGSICVQNDVFFDFSDGSDDCLYLNVYSRSIDSNARQPVMVWIHGGGFLFGSGNDTFYGPDYLMKKDIVLVTINYRLNIFGFLNLNHEVATGNQGLKDQVLALRWVQENIVNFGGDPNNVTIFGESAGGASVHFLTMSPLAKGLFHKAISHSGVATCPWSYSLGDQRVITGYLCEYLGENITDPVEIVDFLQTVDHRKIIDALEYLKKTKGIAYNVYCPEVDIKSREPFMPVSSDVAAQEGAHVPYIIGHNNNEGNLMLNFFKKFIPIVDDKVLNIMLHPRSIKTLESYNLTVEDLKNMYCKDGNVTEDPEGLSYMLGDILFLMNIHNVIKNQVETNSGPTYMYQFTYDKGYNVTKIMYNSTISGATHMDELFYLFNMKFFEPFKIEGPKKGTPMYTKMEQMLELWTNFAKTGMPTPTTSELVPLHWQPVNDGKVFRYLEIGEELHMKKMLNIEERLSYKKKPLP